jgi:predicted transcriptional regulator
MPLMPVYGVKEIAEALGIGRTTIIYHIKRRHITAEKVKEAGRWTWIITHREARRLQQYLRRR